MPRRLVYYPDPILRQKAEPVQQFDAAFLTSLAQEMRRIMHDYRGMGLAAPQVGESIRLIIVEYPGETDGSDAIPFTILVNPEITSRAKTTDDMQEGCLSIPYVEVVIPRSLSLSVKAQDVHGRPFELHAKGMFARILQHEIDHLNGTLILDYDHVTETRDKPRTIVWGSTRFTTTVLNTLRETLNITHIITEPPKPVGRKQTLTPTVAKQYADTLGIPTIEPTDLHDPRLHTYLLSLKPDLMLVAAYGRLIPSSLYEIPRYGTLNVHPSLLPHYRGATPIQAALLNGDTQTGVSIMKLAPTFDTGDILAEATYDLDGTETYEDLEYALAEFGGLVLQEILVPYLAGNLQPMPQEKSQASSTKKITLEDRWLDMEADPRVNERKVRAYYPEPGAFVILEGQIMKVLQAHIDNETLVFDSVQPAGKKPMSWQDFERGYRKALHFDPYSSILNKEQIRS